MNLSQKTNEAAPASYYQERLLEAKGQMMQWRTDALLAAQDANRWKKRHASLCKSSALIAVGSFFVGVACGLGSAWIR